MELSDEIQASCGADIYRPLFTHLLAKKVGKNSPPYVPNWGFMPPHQLFQLALLLDNTGYTDDAKSLAGWLLSLEPFPSLWCTEKQFNEKIFQKRFLRLKERFESVDVTKPTFDLSFVQTPRIKAALTIEGNNTSAGVILTSHGVEIRAFAPQGDNLNFGIVGRGSQGWVRTAADPEIWMEMKHSVIESGLQLGFRFVGVKPEKDIFLALYVKAKTCRIGEEELQPKSLHRFEGEAKTVVFNEKNLIQLPENQRIKVIPLAGEGCFWDCQFLLLYPLSSFTSQLLLNIL